MNRCTHMGRLTKDPQNNGAVRFTLAVERKVKAEGQPTADFINFVAFGKRGEFVEKYLKQGTKVLVTSHVQTGNYTNKEGQKIYTTDFVVDDIEFVEGKRDGGNNQAADEPAAEADFTPEFSDDEMPFN